MVTDEDIGRIALHHMGRTGLRPALVVIGAMDGVSSDDLYHYIRRYAWSGLFVEPIPAYFQRLRENYATLPRQADNRYENCAIADHDGTVTMLTIDPQAVTSGNLPWFYAGMSAIDPPRNGLAAPAGVAAVAAHGKRIEVPCLTLATLFARHALERLDLLCIDAEGWDYEILRQLDFATWRPKLIRCEHVNLGDADRAALGALLAAQGYLVHADRMNLDAVAGEYWQTVSAERTRPPEPSALQRGAVTLVTSLRTPADIEAGVLALDWPLLVFAPAELDAALRARRAGRPTVVLHRAPAELQSWAFAPLAGALHAGSAAPSRALDAVLCELGRACLLHDAVLGNPFGTEYFAWIDADIGRLLGDPAAALTAAAERALAARFCDDRLFCLAAPPGAALVGEDVDLARLGSLTGTAPAPAVHACLYGGTRPAIAATFGPAMQALERLLAAGHLPSAAEVLTLTAATHPSLCTLAPLGAAGVRGFVAALSGASLDRAERPA